MRVSSFCWRQLEAGALHAQALITPHSGRMTWHFRGVNPSARRSKHSAPATLSTHPACRCAGMFFRPMSAQSWSSFTAKAPACGMPTGKSTWTLLLGLQSTPWVSCAGVVRRHDCTAVELPGYHNVTLEMGAMGRSMQPPSGPRTNVHMT